LPERFPSLADRVIVVTGGSRGLGREMVLALLDAGARVAITAKTESAALRNTLAAAERTSGRRRIMAFTANVCAQEDCERVVAATLQEWDGLHVLINNAALGDGRTVTARHNSGIPAIDVDDQGRRLKKQFIALVELLLGAKRANMLLQSISKLDGLKDVGELTGQCVL
jgi:NAD(P)-dependent dehydrogenase (short-subunit alcohol dehydrogenase family)